MLEAAATRVSLGWDAPLSDGDAVVLSYQIECLEVESEGADWAPCLSLCSADLAPTASITALKPICTYLFRVRASNDVGTGPYGVTAPVRTLSTVPRPPEHVEVHEVKSNSVAVEWGPTPFDGGSPVTQVIIEYLSSRAWMRAACVDVGVAVQQSRFRVVVSGLVPQTRYRFRIILVNAQGESAPSAASVEVTTDFDRPAAPTAPVASDVKEDSLSLRFQLPLTHGSSLHEMDFLVRTPKPKLVESEILSDEVVAWMFAG